MAAAPQAGPRRSTPARSSLGPAFGSTYASVDATSGALDTDIGLPSYNPNVPALALTYDSLTANPCRSSSTENTLSSSAAVPSKVSAS